MFEIHSWRNVDTRSSRLNRADSDSQNFFDFFFFAQLSFFFAFDFILKLKSTIEFSKLTSKKGAIFVLLWGQKKIFTVAVSEIVVDKLITPWTWQEKLSPCDLSKKTKTAFEQYSLSNKRHFLSTPISVKYNLAKA